MQIYLAGKKTEHILFIMFSLIYNFKYLDIWYVGFHLYSCPKSINVTDKPDHCPNVSSYGLVFHIN